jgi:hypothetical protein
MADELRGWQADPFGVHESRFFSDDGKPTLLVRDGETKTYDPPPRLSDRAFVAESDSRLETLAPGLIPAPAVVSNVWDDPALRRDPVMNDHRLAPLSIDSDRPPPPPLAKPHKVAYAIVLTAMLASALALVLIHLGSRAKQPRALSATTTTKVSTTTTSTDPPTTQAIPPAPKPTAAIAAADLISSWAAGNQAEALAVATAPAVSTLFAGHYVDGLAIDRGCSVAFSPIVCTYGPPGGAAPTDPIYELSVVQSAGAWYVSSVTINN